MAKTSTLQEYARMGATARIGELQAEIAAIHRIFPDLADSATAHKHLGSLKVASSSPALAKLMDSAPKRRRRKMSAAGRKAISDAQKARWAKLKAGK
jgi:hypothetical protein